jgi:ectoine hydroxylase-related dioxygenase (phytanoyl-CoA dioxygenase family)
MVAATSPNPVQQFEQNGYVVLPDLFDPNKLADISDEVDALIGGRAAYVPEQDLIWEPGVQPKRLRNAFRMHLYNEAFLRFAQTPRLLEVLHAILGRPLRLYSSQIFAKPARVGSAVPSHQDMPYWPFAPYELVSAWIALDDSTIANGCVRMRAGSHRLGLLPHGPSHVTGNSLGLAPNAEVEILPEHPIEVQRGTCVLHHCLTVHRSEPNRSEQPRRGLIYVYMSPRVELTDPSRMGGPAIFPVVD